jgi:hypothetical protein
LCGVVVGPREISLNGFLTVHSAIDFCWCNTYADYTAAKGKNGLRGEVLVLDFVVINNSTEIGRTVRKKVDKCQARGYMWARKVIKKNSLNRRFCVTSDVTHARLNPVNKHLRRGAGRWVKPSGARGEISRISPLSDGGLKIFMIPFPVTRNVWTEALRVFQSDWKLFQPTSFASWATTVNGLTEPPRRDSSSVNFSRGSPSVDAASIRWQMALAGHSSSFTTHTGVLID